MTNKEALELALITLDRDNLKVGNIYVNYDIKKALIKLIKKKLEKKKQKDIPNNLPIANLKEDELMYPPQREPVLPGGGGGSGVPTINGVPLYSGLPQSEPEALIRADELETIGAESSLARAMAARTIRLLYKENEKLRAQLGQSKQKAQFIFREYGPHNWNDSELTKPGFVAEQKTMNEALRKRVMDGMPDMPIKVQDKREENHKSFAQFAQAFRGQDGYNSAKAEWVELTAKDIAVLWKATPHVVGVYTYTDIARDVEAKLKEKNCG